MHLKSSSSSREIRTDVAGDTGARVAVLGVVAGCSEATGSGRALVDVHLTVGAYENAQGNDTFKFCIV